MKVNEVRIINANQEKRKVFFHLKNGKTIVRTMYATEIIKANTIGHFKGESARVAEFVRLFNEKYSKPQTIRYVELASSERRFFELHNMRSTGILTPDEEDEYRRLLDE